MRSLLAILFLTPILTAAGLVVPDDRTLPPLAMTTHRVNADIADQVGVTTLEQEFRNHTSRQLEATYLFPVPKGAAVDKFTMWIDGKETRGEVLPAAQAKKIYHDVVRRTLDPGLLEYVGTDLLQMKVFPVPAHGTVKVKVRFTAVASKDGNLIEYVYPLRTDGKATRTLDDFTVTIRIKSSSPLASIYSPTHAISVDRIGSREAVIGFEKRQALLDKDFQLFYGTTDANVGLTAINYRPVSSEDGYFMFLVSPEIEAAKNTRVARDIVLVVDTSGSMSDVKMAQARKALKHCLNNLGKEDRFACVSFATQVRTFKDDLCDNNPDNLERANKWADDLRQSGGTAIQPALLRALDFSPRNDSRPFTIVFFTDGMPTVDETNPAKIVKTITDKNTANTRIFTFGVGDDVNAAMLDQLSEATKAVSTYVRPQEDIEVKVSALHDKISQPVLTNVRLAAQNINLHEVYPAKLPDLFFGGQLVVLGRYSGQGTGIVKVKGNVGKEEKEFVYEINFPGRTTDGKEFVEHLWARRKVGYLLDQIRNNGEKKELVDEATKLAIKYGIATPYTSYLVVPDAPLPTHERGRGNFNPYVPGATPLTSSAGIPMTAAPSLGGVFGGGYKPGENVATARGAAQDKAIDDAVKQMKPEDRNKAEAEAMAKAKGDAAANIEAAKNYAAGRLHANQSGKTGVDLAVAANQLRNQERLTVTANRAVHGRNIVEVGGIWIDDTFKPTTPVLSVQAGSDAYFKLLDAKPELKDVFVLGNYVVWVTPSGTALAIDAKGGKTTLEDAEISKLFTR